MIREKVSIRNQEVDVAVAKNILSKLIEAPVKKLTLQEKMAHFMDDVLKALEAGHSVDAIAKALTDGGAISISAPKLRSIVTAERLKRAATEQNKPLDSTGPHHKHG